MENGPFIDDFPIKTSIDGGFSMAMLVITRCYPLKLRFGTRLAWNSSPGRASDPGGPTIAKPLSGRLRHRCPLDLKKMASMATFVTKNLGVLGEKDGYVI